MPLIVRSPDNDAFAPFGAFIDAPAHAGDRRMFSSWLAPVGGLSLQFHTNRVAASSLPVTVERVERHPRAPQVFLPLRVTRYLVVVMPADAAGQPDPAASLAFAVPGTIGVVYRAGTWHASMTALDDDACFAVLMWRGAEDDDVVAAIPPVVVLPPRTSRVGPRA